MTHLTHLIQLTLIPRVRGRDSDTVWLNPDYIMSIHRISLGTRITMSSGGVDFDVSENLDAVIELLKQVIQPIQPTQQEECGFCENGLVRGEECPHCFGTGFVTPPGQKP